MLRRLLTRILPWLGIRSNPWPIWLDVPAFEPWHAQGAAGHAEHNFEHVSRHAIAETGLVCPRCETLVAPRGDYTRVRASHRGEVIKCHGQWDANDQTQPCPFYLFASPDTEHGDHILWDKVPKGQREKLFYRFVRKEGADVVRETYGDDVAGAGGALAADPSKTLAAPPVEFEDRLVRCPDTGAMITARVQKRKPAVFAFEPGQFYSTAPMGRIAMVTRVQQGDPFYDGWCWVVFDGGNPKTDEWMVDPQGVVHRDMRDPTMNNDLKLQSLIANA